MTLQTIDSVRAFWDQSPCFVRRSAAPKDSKQFMDETEARKFKSEPHIPGFAEYGKWTGKKVLEIGCGIGIDSVNFARADAWVCSLDLSAASLQLARKRAELAKVYKPVFIHGDAEKLDETSVWGCDFDLVYAFGSIHHSPNPEKILHNIRFVTHPGSILKLMVYNKYSWKSLWILLKYGHGRFWKFGELIAKYSEAQTGCPITHVYSRKELRAMLERNGFKVQKISVDHIFPYDIEAYKRHEYKVVWYFRWIPKSWFRAFERVAGWHLLCEATV